MRGRRSPREFFLSSESTWLEILESRIDWVTATIKPGAKQATLHGRAMAWQEQRKNEGYQVKPWSWMGYVGTTVDGCTWGTRETDSMVRLSGEVAARRGAVALTWADNVSRLDIEVTLRDHDIARNWADRANADSKRDPRVLAGMTETRIIRSTPSGTTAYVGSRSSSRFMRCYDKTSESDGAYPLGCWRWEVEYKKERANIVARGLQTSGYKPSKVLQIVKAAWADYQHRMPCDGLPDHWADKGVKHETNDEKRLAWLRRSIRPMVERMREGTNAAVLLDAIGFGDVVDVGTGELTVPEWTSPLGMLAVDSD